MHELDEKLKARGLRVMAVTEVDPDDLEDDKQAVVSVTKEHHIDYPTLLDTEGAWMKRAGIEGVPAFLVIGRDGKLAYRHRGPVLPDSEAFAELQKAVETALGPS